MNKKTTISCSITQSHKIPHTTTTPKYGNVKGEYAHTKNTHKNITP